MQVGKLSNQQLKDSILTKLKPIRNDIALRPAVGEDCAGVLFGEDVCVLSTDPITAAGKYIGKLGVQISANDIISSGAEPIGVMLTILAPPATTLDEIEGVISEAVKTAETFNMEILGGHTEITDAVNRIVISTTVIGRVAQKKLIRSSGAQVGDDIILTKWAGLEGTAILANDYEYNLSAFISDEELAEAKNLGDLISISKEGQLASSAQVSCMHDVTEGGVLGAVWEIAEASGKGIEIWLDSIPLLPITRKICQHFSIDPFRLISSGSLLICSADGNKLVNQLLCEGIQGTIIGKVIENGRYCVGSEGKRKLSPPESDEIYKVVSAHRS